MLQLAAQAIVESQGYFASGLGASRHTVDQLAKRHKAESRRQPLQAMFQAFCRELLVRSNSVNHQDSTHILTMRAPRRHANRECKVVKLRCEAGPDLRHR